MPPMLLHDPDTDDWSAPLDPPRSAAELGAAADARTAELDAAAVCPPTCTRRPSTPGCSGSSSPRARRRRPAPVAWFRTGMALARHEASLAWVVTQGAAELGWIAAGGDDRLGRRGARRPARGVGVDAVAGFGPLVVDGDRSRFSGRWAFNTGRHGATWIGGLARSTAGDDGRPAIVRWAWVPADRAVIVEDWDPSGLRGTGSHTTVDRGAGHPDGLDVRPLAPTDQRPRPAPRASSATATGRSPPPSPPSSSATPGAPSTRPVTSSSPRRRRPTSCGSPTTPPCSGARRGRGALAGRRRRPSSASSRRCGRRPAARGADRGRRGPPAPRHLTADRSAVRAVELACEITGTASLPRGHVLGRCRRDAEALRAHISVNGAAADQTQRLREEISRLSEESARKPSPSSERRADFEIVIPLDDTTQPSASNSSDGNVPPEPSLFREVMHCNHFTTQSAYY